MNSDFKSWSSMPPQPLFEEVASREGACRKRLHWAFLRWLMLGSHYLYLRRPFMQALFWLTLGGLLLWWLIDLPRLGELVRRHNQCALAELQNEYHDLLEQRLRSQAYQTQEQPAFRDQPAAPMGLEQAASRFETRPGAILLLSGALLSAVALYLFNPPPLFPH